MDRWRLVPEAGTRVAVIGGTRAIGRAVVGALAAAGAAVAVLDLPDALAHSRPEESVRSIALDPTDAASVATALAQLADWRALDACVMLPCATCDRDPVATAAPGAWEGAIAGELRSTFLIARRMLPLLSRGRDPALVLAASCLGAVGRPGYRPCSAARAGVIALTRTLALEAAPLVRVNCVAPHIETADEAQAPLGRPVMADDVAGPLLFLLGPAARYMTGQTLHVNGGAHMP